MSMPWRNSKNKRAMSVWKRMGDAWVWRAGSVLCFLSNALSLGSSASFIGGRGSHRLSSTGHLASILSRQQYSEEVLVGVVSNSVVSGVVGRRFNCFVGKLDIGNDTGEEERGCLVHRFRAVFRGSGMSESAVTNSGASSAGRFPSEHSLDFQTLDP